MAQYKTGSVNVTNGSATVTGVDTLWSAEVSAGDIFTIVGDNAWYEVGSVGSNTSITLTSTYAGSTASGAQYAISRDFTTNKSIPYPQKGDIETASLLKRAMNIIDNELSTGFDSSNVTITGGTINGTTIGGTTAAAVSATTLTTSSTVTHNGGTANSVCFLNGSKVLTTGSALTFDGTNLATTGDVLLNNARYYYGKSSAGSNVRLLGINSGNTLYLGIDSGPTSMIVNASSTSTNIAFNASGTEQMRLTSTGLGIGTSSPAYKLDVQSTGYPGINVASTSASGNNGAFIQTKNGGGATSILGTETISGGYSYTGAIANSAYVGALGANPLQLITNSVARATLDSSGNLGLGVTPSASTLRMLQGPNAEFVVAARYPYIASNATNNGGWKYTNTEAASFYVQATGQHQWYTAPSGTAGNAISFTQAMTLHSSGGLSIGATGDPGVGSLVLDGGSGAGRVTISAVSGYNGILSTTTGFGAWRALQFFTKSGDASATIDSSGNLGLGVTPSAWWANAKALQVRGAAMLSTGNTNSLTANAFLDSTPEWRYINTAAATHYEQTLGQHRWFTAPSGTAGNAISFTQAMTLDASGNLLVAKTSSSLSTVGVELGSGYSYFTSSGINQYVNRTSDGETVRFYRSGTQVGSISVTTTATAYNTSSDYRLKNITGPITTSGAYIDSLNPVEGTWKADGSTFVGLIAHEVQEASRTTVATGVKDGEQMQGMDYSSAEIIANLIAEVKALRQRLAAAGI